MGQPSYPASDVATTHDLLAMPVVWTRGFASLRSGHVSCLSPNP